MNFGDQQILERRLRTVSRVSAAISAAAGLVVLFGWAFDIYSIVNISPGLATMKVNTSIAFTLLGVALWLANLQPGVKRKKVLTRVYQACAVAVGLIGVLTLSEYVFGGPRIDNLIIS